ncbi:MAG: ComEC/Rec2 family competence protein, partial [Candidatus Omnitrophota bacterium]
LYLNSNIWPDNHISHFLGEERLKTSVVGIIKSPALTRKPYYGKINSTYLFEIEEIKAEEDLWSNVQGLSQIRIQTEKDYQYGDRLLVNGTIRKPGLPLTPTLSPEGRGRRVFNYREYLERQNTFALINTKENNVTLLSHNYKSNPILRYIYLLREKLKNQIIEKMPLDSGAFLRAILLGDRSELPKHIQASFKSSGTMHILAISGLHIGLIVIVILYFLRFMRVRREFSYILTIILLIFFALVALSRPSIVRAVIMASVFLIGLLLGRRMDMYNTLGAAAIFILIRNPDELFNVGFQLSFLAVLAILFLMPRFMNPVRKSQNYLIKKYLYTPLAVSMAAWLGTFPLIAYYFGIITPVAIIANLFIIPALFVALVAGLAFLLLGWVPFATAALVFMNNVSCNLIFSLADFFASFRFGHFYL